MVEDGLEKKRKDIEGERGNQGSKAKREKVRMMVGRSRIERCSGCRAPVAFPVCARSVRCAMCGSVTHARHTHQSVRKATVWVKGIIYNGFGSFSGHRCDPPTTRTSDVAVAPPPSYPAAHGSKRALLCGVSYKGRPYKLEGTVNDVNCMRYLLRERFDFPDDSILVLTEEERDPCRIPTMQNMRAAMQWLVRGSRAGDSLVFHFSGHGSQKLDSTGDEVDGFDETLCPLDYEMSGMLQDDEINATIVRPLPAGAKLHAVIDACHSGTALDLPYLCRMNRSGFCQWDDHSPRVYKGTNGGLAISFSGCDDHQTSADTSALTGSVSTGAMTYSFILALESEPRPTYGRMLSIMRSVIRGADTGIRLIGPISSLVRRVFSSRLSQEPQLSSSEMFDVYRKPFLL